MLWHVVESTVMGTVGAVGLSLVACWSFLSGEASGDATQAPVPSEVTLQGIADQRFLSELALGTIAWAPSTAVGAGQRVCGALREHSPTEHVIDILRGKGLTPPQAYEFLGAAVTAYCPDERAYVGG